MFPSFHLVIVPFSANLLFSAFAPWKDKVGPAIPADAPRGRAHSQPSARAPGPLAVWPFSPLISRKCSQDVCPGSAASGSLLCVYTFAFHCGLSSAAAVHLTSHLSVAFAVNVDIHLRGGKGKGTEQEDVPTNTKKHKEEELKIPQESG